MTVNKAGTVTLTATQAATSNYKSGTKTATLTIAKAAPTVGTWAPLAAQAPSPAITLTYPTSNSTGAWSATSSNTAVATVSGNTVTIIGAGTTTLTATQAATADYLSATATTTLTVTTATGEACANGEQTCAIFTAALKHANIKLESPLVLSTVNTSAGTTSQYASAQASRSHTVGKHYWEMTRGASPSSGWNGYVCGLAPVGFSLSKLAGYEGGYGFAHPTAPAGSVYSCMLDLDAGTLTWKLNGVAKATVSVTPP